MSMQQDNGGSMIDRIRTTSNVIAFIAGVLAVSVEVFLHRSRTFGERYIGLQGAAVILLIPLYTLFWPGYDVMPLMEFLLVYLFMCFAIRMGVLSRGRSGNPQFHSRYTGTPWIMALTGRMSERTVKAKAEPLLVFLVAILITPLSEPLGGYLMLASLGLLASVNLNMAYERVRTLDMHDVFLEQRELSDRFREMRGDGF